MDTRRKIVDASDAERLIRDLLESGKPFRVVAGYFDPIVGAHVRRIREISREGETLVVCLLTPPLALLPDRARAELAAALAAVRYVVLPDDGAGAGLPGWLGMLPADLVVLEEQADLDRRHQLVELICRKSAV